MYKDTVTLFNRRTIQGGDVEWYATVLEGVNLNIDRAAIVRDYGEASQDTCILNVRLDGDTIGGKTYLSPKEWRRGNDPGNTITFQTGEDADFFYVGAWDGNTVIPNSAYGIIGFRDYMERFYDHVFEVTSVSYFSVIPHLEITGK